SRAGGWVTGQTIVVDGGSEDDTVALAKSLADRVINAGRGRASQMNAGADQARGDILLFLHADTRLPDNFQDHLESFWLSGRAWGRFDVRLSGRRLMFRVIETLMNLRSRWTGICTGDQAIFVKRRVIDGIGGFVQMPLMEDIEISRRLKRISRPYCVPSPVVTSSRRWEDQGVWRTILLMWSLRLRYFLGASPERLVEKYYR
ncbi:MAG: TIGR04283 family arsenosugar biosynthesis glycosyltransferase, partial [Pseudomonadales bacterium]|nr:TIGR04283 family arsenosugar biosynthesis glycosyltransferase [Pseudomonadales bacterium]